MIELAGCKLRIMGFVEACNALTTQVHMNFLTGGGRGEVYLPSFLKDDPISKTLSNPPTIKRFNHNSGAILKDNGLSGNSDADVWKGLATAPPAADASMGVSTSVKDRSRKKFRTYCIMENRARNVSEALELESS